MNKLQDKEIVRKIFETRSSLEKSGNKNIFKEFGLSVGTYVPLKMVFLGVSAIKDMMAISKETAASLGQKIQKLENLGFVERRLDQTDKRKWSFTITGKGERVLHDAENRFSQVSANLLLGLTDQEKAELYRLLEKIENNVSS